MARARKRERMSKSTKKGDPKGNATAKGLLESVRISVKDPQVLCKQTTTCTDDELNALIFYRFLV